MILFPYIICTTYTLSDVVGGEIPHFGPTTNEYCHQKEMLKQTAIPQLFDTYERITKLV